MSKQNLIRRNPASKIREFADRLLAKRRVRKFSTSRIFGIQPLDRDGRQS